MKEGWNRFDEIDLVQLNESVIGFSKQVTGHTISSNRLPGLKLTEYLQFESAPIFFFDGISNAIYIDSYSRKGILINSIRNSPNGEDKFKLLASFNFVEENVK